MMDDHLDDDPTAPADTGDTPLELVPSQHVDHPRWVIVALVVPIVALVVANNVGAVLFTSSLHKGGLVEHPLRILALNSTNKILLATGFQTEWPWYTIVPTLRLLAPDPLFYLLGYLFRGPALRWCSKVYPGSHRLFQTFEQQDRTGMHRMLDALVLIMPNNPVCLLAGVAGMPVKRFVVLNLVGTLGRVLLFRWLSFVFEEQIVRIMNLLADYQKWAILVTVVVVVIAFAAQARRFVSSTEELADEEG
jgi:membrane protein DedA with SNARE-associated domain